ncbi:MAG: hypothetical protein IV097_08870 [Burkholderiaceae bacterium]|nr:hypothetical protein [Burkholderiaceae bacterium]
MLIFIDTEFIQTEDRPHFISVGLLTDNGRELYSELSAGEAETLLQRHPNAFVRDHVLPQLGRIQGVPWAGLPDRLSEWLVGLAVEKVDVIYDFSADFLLVEQLLARVEVPPAVQVQPAHVGYLLSDDDGNAAAAACWHAIESVRGIARHHALADAYALRARFETVHPTGRPVEVRTIEVQAKVVAIIKAFELVHAETDGGQLTLSIGESTPGVDWRRLAVGQRLDCVVRTGAGTRVLSARLLP